MTFQPVKKTQQGFTLIELLVVIAIIGILAAMVITNLRTARAKARDASAITSMSSARAEAENFYDENDLSYLGLCQAGVTYSPNTPPAGLNNFENLLIAAANANSNNVVCNVAATTFQTYYATVDLEASGDVFCIDSSGFAGKGAYPVTTSGECR